MNNQKEALLTLLFVNDKTQIETQTHMHKILYLAQERLGINTLFTFESRKYGPYSESLVTQLEQLESSGYITTSGTGYISHGGNTQRAEDIGYEITLKGSNALNDLDYDQELFKNLKLAKTKWGGKDPLELVDITT